MRGVESMNLFSTTQLPGGTLTFLNQPGSSLPTHHPLRQTRSSASGAIWGTEVTWRDLHRQEHSRRGLWPSIFIMYVFLAHKMPKRLTPPLSRAPKPPAHSPAWGLGQCPQAAGLSPRHPLMLTLPTFVT